MFDLLQLKLHRWVRDTKCPLGVIIMCLTLCETARRIMSWAGSKAKGLSTCVTRQCPESFPDLNPERL